MKSIIKKFASFACLLSFVLMQIFISGSLIARAATVTGTTDTLSTVATGTLANHTIVFTTPSGVGDGETITVRFPSDFDTASITEDDVDVMDDSVDLTTATTCAGTEQASVVLASNTFTITICSGDGGAIASASEVTIEIGNHTTSSGTGTNQITNPSDETSYLIQIGGTFGDIGSIALAFTDPGVVSVQAEVTGGTGSSPGGSGPSGETTNPDGPDISDVACSASETSLTITWTTDEEATSEVDYGLTSDYSLGTKTNSDLSTNHSVSISALTSNITYHYHVRSTDEDGNEDISDDETCVTSDTTGLILSQIEVQDVTEEGATITFTTDESANCTVSYGTTASYGSSKTESGYGTSHSIELSNLEDNTTYHYSINCEDTSTNTTQTTDSTFTTDEDLTPANVSGFACTEQDSALSFSWTMPNENDLNRSILVCNTSDYPTSSSDKTVVYTGDASSTSTTVSGLTNETIYYCAMFVIDNDENTSSGAVDSCAPKADVIEDETETDTEEEGGEVVVVVEEETGDETQTDVGTETGTDTSGTGTETGTETDETVDTGTVSEDTTGDTESGSSDDQQESEIDVWFLSAENTIKLSEHNGIVDVIPESIISIFIPVDETIESIIVTIGEDTYLLSEEYDGDELIGYRVYFTVPETSAAVEIIIDYTDGTQDTITYQLHVISIGYVYEILDSAVSRISEATVSLLVSQFGSWRMANVVNDGSQQNPMTTGQDGTFVWYVSNGTYRITAGKTGYKKSESDTFVVNNNIATILIRFEPIPLTIAEILAKDLPLNETVVLFIGNALYEAEQILETIQNIPELQTTAEIATPATIVLGLSGISILFRSFNLLPLLQYLVTSPILFFAKRKRHGWGVVYNAATKLPIDLAIVRLYSVPENKLIATRVTDKIGRFFFLVNAGAYKIVATKFGFAFPSVLLSGIKEDGKYLDVYHGEEIEVKDKETSISPNIPIEQQELKELTKPKAIIFKQFLRRLQQTISLVGTLLAFFIFIIQPSALTFVGVLVQIMIYLFSKRLTKIHKPKNWGIVYDTATKKPITSTIVRIFEPKYNKLLETAVTDTKGRYSFLVGPSSYMATYEKPGYKKLEVRPIDISPDSHSSEIAFDVNLSKETEKL